MKNSIKKTFLLIVALTGLVACNNQTSTSSSSAQPTSSASTISSNSSSSSITNSSTSSSKPSSSSSSTIDYGKVYFNDIQIWSDYDHVRIRPYFTKPEMAENEVFDYFVVDESICYIEDDEVVYLSEGRTDVIATSEHFSYKFIVGASQTFNYSSMARSMNNLVDRDGLDENLTVFLGDSFFDFWRNGINNVTKWENYYSEYKAINIGIGGTKTHDWRAMNKNIVCKTSPKNIIINLGTNNLNGGELANQTFLNMRDLLEDYQYYFPDAKIYIFTVTRCTGALSVNWSKAQQYNQKLKDYAETKDAITVLDVAERFGLDYQDYLASDGLHLNQNAYEVYNEMIFDAVELEGTTVSRASVHNVSILKELKLGIGDKILVYKANMIIPQIQENKTQSGTCVIPDKCPVCGASTTLEQEHGSVFLLCPNKECYAKKIKLLTHFVSRNAMNIDGLSESTLEKFVADGMIHSLTDIFYLEKYQDKIVEMEGFGEKSYDNLIESIEKAKQIPLANLLYSLGIKGIGLSMAKLIAEKYPYPITKMQEITGEDLLKVDGIGEVLAKSFVRYFADKNSL